MSIRIAVLVSGGGTNLQALIDAQARGLLKNGSINLVISSQDGAYALLRAQKHGIPAYTIARNACASQQEFEAKLRYSLQSHEIELIVLAGFMHILSEDFIRAYEKRILNVHPSLIPSFCGKGFYGLKVHQAVIAHGVKISGATVHYVNEIPDGGEIILQKAVDVLPDDDPATLQRRIMEEAEWLLLPKATEMVAQELLHKR